MNQGASAKLSAPLAAVVVAAAMTGLAGVEHGFAPWRPFYLTYAALCLIVPLLARTGKVAWPRLGPLGWIMVALAPFVLQAATGAWLNLGWPALLAVLGVPASEAAGPSFNPAVALPQAIGQYAPHWDMPPERMILLYVLFITLWAGIGEELFYRGYLHEALRRWGVWTAALAGNAFFALRHAIQLQGPDYPWAAAAAWVGFSFALGLAFTWLYERTDSLWPPVLAHTLFNVIPFVALIGAAV